jgi:hypothetical protein
MGYYAGTSTGPNDLLDKLRIALLAEGWSVDDYSSVGAGYRLHVHKTLGGEVCYFNFRSAIAETGTTLITEDNAGGAEGTVTGIIVNGSTGYDGGQLWHKQPGFSANSGQSDKSFGCCMSPMSISAIPAYYFFFNGDSVHIAVEITAGKFQFMSFGMLVKQGTFTGGRYFTASLPSYKPQADYMGSTGYQNATPCYFTPTGSDYAPHGAVYVNVDSLTSWRNADYYSGLPKIAFPCVAGQKMEYSYATKTGMCSYFYDMSPDAYNAMAAMCPIYINLKRSDNNYSLIGWPEGVRFLNVTNYDSAEEITYGAETWKVFNANSMDYIPLNMYCGFAFLKDV